MRNRVNKSNKKNIYCAHCKHWCGAEEFCEKKDRFSKYYQRCKSFEWADDIVDVSVNPNPQYVPPLKRLTIRNSDGSISQPTHSTFEKVFKRLTEYEDTGLTPEEIMKMKNSLSNGDGRDR